MSLSTPGSLDNANYIPTNIPCTQIPKLIQQLWRSCISTTVIYHGTKLNFIMIIKSISVFQRFVLNNNANFEKISITIFLQGRENHRLILRIFLFPLFKALARQNSSSWRTIRVGKNPNRHTLTITAGDTVIEQRASFSQPFPPSLSAAPLPYDIRFDFFFISVCLTVRPRNKEDGRRGRGWRARALLCLLLLFLRAHHPIPPSTPFRPSITLHSSAWCSLLRLITGYLGEVKRKTERGRKGGRRGGRREVTTCA